jgi:[ribosomal protein S5]-alanine N-acetyltransferase
MQNSRKRIVIRQLLPGDVGDNYLAWMNDPEVTQFLESRWKPYQRDDLEAFVASIRASGDDFLFGIFLQESGEHIGNIKIGNINRIHRYADLGLVIGAKQFWGQGYATEAIRLATEYAFQELNLNKLVAQIYAPNVGSRKAFENAGYRVVGQYSKHRFYKGRFVDAVLVERCRDDGADNGT